MIGFPAHSGPTGLGQPGLVRSDGTALKLPGGPPPRATVHAGTRTETFDAPRHAAPPEKSQLRTEAPTGQVASAWAFAGTAAQVGSAPRPDLPDLPNSDAEPALSGAAGRPAERALALEPQVRERAQALTDTAPNGFDRATEAAKTAARQQTEAETAQSGYQTGATALQTPPEPKLVRTA